MSFKNNIGLSIRVLTPATAHNETELRLCMVNPTRFLYAIHQSQRVFYSETYFKTRSACMDKARHAVQQFVKGEISPKWHKHTRKDNVLI